MLNEAPLHRSPNAGWPESALAHTLNVRLAGPRYYGETYTDEPYFNTAGPDPTGQDLRRGLDCYRRLMYLIVISLILIATLQIFL